jgi:hypothetical protein
MAKQRQIILTFFDENDDIPVFLEKLMNIEVLPENYSLDLGPAIIPNVEKVVFTNLDYSEEKDEQGKSKFVTLTIAFLTGETA